MAAADACRCDVLVVSHACAVSVNQAVYERLALDGCDIRVVVPGRWRHPYDERPFRAVPLPGLAGRLVRSRVFPMGSPQRHVHVRSVARLLDRAQPQVVFVEEESFSVPAFQWARACARRSIPFGVQAAENLDRALPLPARLIRRWVLPKAAFVAARSPGAGALAMRYGARSFDLIPHAVPPWEVKSRAAHDVFTVGYAGRLVREKGVLDVVAAVERMPGPVELLVVGDGPLRAELERLRTVGPVRIRVLADVSHAAMTDAFTSMDLLVLPSRTTPTWAEQFGRVLVEALWCGTPVVASSSGEMPWVIDVTGGGRIFPEGDVPALTAQLTNLREDADARAYLASIGRRRVEERFSVEAVAAVIGGTLDRASRRESVGVR